VTESSVASAGGGGEGTGGAGGGGHVPLHLDLTPETNWGVLVRRTRYFVAVVLSAFLFCTIGWYFASPLPEMEGVSLVVWQNHGLLAAIGLAVVLLAATAVCTVLVHPDAPHMGLFCALLGLAGLSIKGGTIHMMLEYGEGPRLFSTLPAMTWTKLSQMLMVESVQWAFLFLIAEVFARLLHDKFFANTRWITRNSPDLVTEALRTKRIGVKPKGQGLMGEAHSMAKALQTDKLRRRFAAPLAMVVNSAITMLLLKVFLQNEAKGQVLIGCFIAFAISTVMTYLLFSQAPMQAFFLTVPAVAVVGYWYGGRVMPEYPGHAAFYMMRALPIDYFSAGMAGVVLGYYGGMRWLLNSETGEECGVVEVKSVKVKG